MLTRFTPCILKKEPSIALILLMAFVGPTMSDVPVSANIWQPPKQRMLRPRQIWLEKSVTQTSTLCL